jgi:hypothetical protein
MTIFEWNQLMNDDCGANSNAISEDELHALRDQDLAVVAMRAFPDSSQIIVFVEASAAEYSQVMTIDIHDV